jgi:hypothetical protein
MYIENFNNVPILYFCQVCRRVDMFVCNLYITSTANKNVEVNGRDNFKLFQHGITHFIRQVRRIDGGWHISIARHLQIFLGNTNMIGTASKEKYAVAYGLVFAVHTNLRLPVLKQGLQDYQDTINELLNALVDICLPSTPKSLCNSIKFHWPRHWADTRRQLGCAAAEKSLERKLGEIQKRNFAFTNARHNVSVSDAQFISKCTS